jgi:hypothetical protein
VNDQKTEAPTDGATSGLALAPGSALENSRYALTNRTPGMSYTARKPNNSMTTENIQPPQTLAEAHDGRVSSGPSLGSHESSRDENANFIFIQGYTLTNDHATTGRDWYRLVEKRTGERHSGPPEKLWRIFSGLDTIESLYA